MVGLWCRILSTFYVLIVEYRIYYNLVVVVASPMAMVVCVRDVDSIVLHRGASQDGAGAR